MSDYRSRPTEEFFSYMYIMADWRVFQLHVYHGRLKSFSATCISWPTEGFFSYMYTMADWRVFQLHVYHGENKLHLDEILMMYIRRATLSWIFTALAHRNNSHGGRHVAPLRHINLIPSQQVFALKSLKLSALRRSSKYQFYILWFGPAVARIHDLPHSRRGY